ncbi:hypothetical protein WA158_001916 [Blastocystis sp. Blastoise]
MVVLLCAVLTKSGKVLLSREFVNISRAKVEGYLTVFPKLLGETAKQHTFIENNQVRYVYQPLENLIILIVTTLSSNIIQDIETLRTLSKAVPEFAESVKEEAIIENAFKIIMAIDELLTYGGHVEPISLQQVRVNLAMESHEEKLVNMVNESKMNAAKELSKQKAKELTAQVRPAATTTEPAVPVAATPTLSPAYKEPEVYRSPTPQQEIPASFSSGLKLGAKKANSLMNDFVREENISLPATPSRAAVAAKVEPVQPQAPVDTHDVNITIEETISASISRDGSINNLEIKGSLSLYVTNPACQSLQVHTQSTDLSRVQLMIHPTIDKQKFISEGILMLKDSKRSFPLNNSVSVIRWKVPSQDPSYLPLTLTCWPEQDNNGNTVTLEYTFNPDIIASLSDVHICIPLPHPSSSPDVTACEDHYTYFNKDSILQWDIPTINADNAEGTMEFHITEGTEEDFFPVTVSFITEHTYSTLNVDSVITSDNVPVDFSQKCGLSVNNYSVE